MLSTIYLVGFAIATVSLIFWYYFKNNKSVSRLMSVGFFVGAAIYMVSIFLNDGSLNAKLVVVARDLAILGATGYLFGLLAKNKIVFFAFLALLYAAFQYKLKEVMVSDFAPSTIVQTADDHMDNTRFSVDKDGELLVKVSEGIERDYLGYFTQSDIEIERAFFPNEPSNTALDNYYIFNLPDQEEETIQFWMDEISGESGIDLVEFNEIVQIDPMETKPVPSPEMPVDVIKKFGLNDPNLKDLWGFQAMNIDQLYAYLKKSKVKPKRKARVFILDTGVDAQHEDLKANYKSLKSKYDKDPMGHGTHCAGIAGAVSNNKKGVASFSQNNEFVEITSVTVLSSFGGGTQAGIIKGMIEAADAGADVISMSLGGRSNDRAQKAYQEAVEYCNKKGAIVVVAAGNSNADAKLFAPANAPGAITVTALAPDLNRAKFSNFIQNVDYGIAAPGVQIYSSIPKDKYAFFNGTSMATPYVAGLIGVMKSLHPKLTTKQAHDILTKTGADTGDTKETGKFIQPAKAIGALSK